MHCDRRSLQNAVRNVLDGDLLSKYLYLSTMERSELAKKIGTTQDIVSSDAPPLLLAPHLLLLHMFLFSLQILDDLLEIDRVTAHF